ncbi:MAG TPA: hypothetical protein VHK67_03890 [Rhabdochlamydiaceae bacterium]|jgi:hypothetical protein|nr:hypothetical protein [Rhabdochlamydiaceae bacterium]
MKKYWVQVFIFALLFFAIYALRHHLVAAVLEYAIKRTTGNPVSYQMRSSESGKLIYEGFSLGEQLHVKEAAFEFEFHLFPFSIDAAVHLDAPTVQFNEEETNLAFLLPSKFWIVKLDIEKGLLVSGEKSICCFEFASGLAKEEIGKLSVYQEEGSSLFTCGLNYRAGSLAADFRMNDAPIDQALPLISLFTPLPAWKTVEGTASAFIQGSIDVDQITFLQGRIALQDIRLESDEIIVAADRATSTIDFQGEFENFFLDTDFKGVNCFWKDLEVLHGEGSIVFKPKESPVFEAHATVHIGDLEGRADLIGRGQINDGRTLFLEGTLDYVTASNPLKLDFSWVDDGKDQVFQTQIRNLGKEILGLLPYRIKQGSLDGQATAYLQQRIFQRLQLDQIKIDHLEIDHFTVQETKLQGSVNLQSGDIEELLIQAQDVVGEIRGYKITSGQGTIAIKASQFDPSSAFGKIDGIPFAVQFQGPFSAFHATAQLSAGASEWLQLPKNPDEPPLSLDLVLDRKGSDMQIAGALICLEDVVQVTAQANLSNAVVKGVFQTARLQPTFYGPLLKIFAPDLKVQGDLAFRGQFSEKTIDFLATLEDAIITSPDFQLSVLGQSKEIHYRYDFLEKRGIGKGKLSPLLLSSPKLARSISISGGDLIFDRNGADGNYRLNTLLEGIEGQLMPKMNIKKGSCSLAFDSLENQLVLQNIKSILCDDLTFFAQEIRCKQKAWEFDAALDRDGQPLLSLQGSAVETPQGYRVTLHEAKASESYLKTPLTFRWTPPAQLEEIRGTVYIDTKNLMQQLDLLDRLGLYTATSGVKEVLEKIQGSITLRLIIEAEQSEYDLQGSFVRYASTLFDTVQVHLVQQGNQWTLKSCALDAIQIRGATTFQNGKWVVSSCEIDWKDLKLHTAGIYDKERFDFKLDGKLNPRFSVKGSGIFFPATPHFQNLSFKIADQTEHLASLFCDKIVFNNGKWQSPALDMTLLSKELSEPLRAKLKLSFNGKTTTFQGPVSQGEYRLGKGSLKIAQITGFYETPYLNLKGTGALDEAPLHYVAKLSKEGGGLNIQHGKDVLKLALLDPTTCHRVEGEIFGLQMHLEREAQGYRGTVVFKDTGKIAEWTGSDALKDLSGLQLTGLFTKETFKGEVEGRDATLKEYLVQEIHASIDYSPVRFKVKNLTVQDPAGSFTIKECTGFRATPNEKWNVTIPLIKGQEIKPSGIRKLAAPQKEIKPLQIRYFVMTDVLGQLGDLNSFRGLGKFNFTQRVKKEPSFFDIPLAMLKDLGLDLDMFSPVMGEAEVQLKDGKLFFTDLQNAFSEGKRSEFYLANEPSYIDLKGGLSLNFRMQQNVVLKFAEPFMIAVRGTWEKPKYSLQ